MNDDSYGLIVSELGDSLEELIWQINVTLQMSDLEDREVAASKLRALRSKLWSTCQLVDSHLATIHAPRIAFTPPTGNMVELSERGG